MKTEIEKKQENFPAAETVDQLQLRLDALRLSEMSAPDAAATYAIVRAIEQACKSWREREEGALLEKFHEDDSIQSDKFSFEIKKGYEKRLSEKETEEFLEEVKQYDPKLVGKITEFKPVVNKREVNRLRKADQLFDKITQKYFKPGKPQIEVSWKRVYSLDENVVPF